MAWNLGSRLSGLERAQTHLQITMSSLKKDTLDIKSLMTEMHQAFKEPHSHTEREHVVIDDDKAEEEPTRQVTLIESSSKPPLTDPILDIPIPQREGKGIATEEQLESSKKLVLASDKGTGYHGRKRKHIELEPKIKVPRLECNRSLPGGVLFVNNMVIEEPKDGIFFTDVFGDQAFQRWNDIYKVRVDSLVSYLVMSSMIET
nr:copia protein [Tanacetum cinerariifolium]